MIMTELQEKQLKQEIQHIFDSGANEIRVLEMVKNFINNRHGELNTLPIPVVSNRALIDYIENDAEIAMPIDEFFNEDGTHITKKQYGKVLLKYLVKELREHYC